MDWPTLLSQHRVEFVETGPNVNGRDYIAVRCPFCGASDPSQHMTIRRTGKVWRCWRNPSHRGRDPAKLLAALLGCSYFQAQTLLGPDLGTPLSDDWLERVKGKLGAVGRPTDQADQVEPLEMPEEFKKFKDVPSASRFLSYLERRGFGREDIWWMTSHYDLRYCTRGPFQGRIIFPIVYEKQLMAWTGRSIYSGEQLRYKTEGPITRQVLWY